MNFLHGYPYSDFHELNLDWLLSKFKEYINKYDDLIEAYEAFINAYSIPEELLEQLNLNRVLNTRPTGNSIRMYVSLDGDDDNPGTSANQPMKTLTTAIQKASILYNDIRVQILTSGVYDVESISFSNAALHLNAAVGDVTVRFLNNAAFYTPHINLTGASVDSKLKIKVDSDSKLFYIDGGSLSAHYVDFDCMLRLNGSWSGFAGCIFHNMYTHGCFNTLTGDENIFNDKVLNNKPAIHVENGSLLVSGSLNVMLSGNNVGDFIYARGGVVDIGHALQNIGSGKYAGGININHSIALLPPNVITSLYSIIDGNVYIGPVSISNTKSFDIDQTFTFSGVGNAWTAVQQLTVPEGAHLIRLQIHIPSGLSSKLNIRAAVPTFGNRYNTISAASGATYGEMMLFTTSNLETEIPIAILAEEGKEVTILAQGIRI